MDPLYFKWVSVKAKVYAVQPKQKEMETRFLEEDILRPGQHYNSLHEWDLDRCRFCYFWICVIMCIALFGAELVKKKKWIYQIFGNKIANQKFATITQ